MVNEGKQIRNILLILLVILIFAVIKQLASLLIPLILAGLLTVLNLPIVNALEKKKFPRHLIMPVVALVTLLVVFLVIWFIQGVMRDLIQEQMSLAGELAEKAERFFLWLEQLLPGEALTLDSMQEELLLLVSPQRLASLLGSLAGSLSSFGGSTFLFLLYYLILLSGATRYQEYVNYVAGSEAKVLDIWLQTQRSISAYMGIKTFTSALTGVVVGLLCWAFGLKFALFWGFLTFLLNYIPSIGSIIATIIPLLMAVIQFDSGGKILFLGLLLGIIQFLIGNVLDPYLLGNRLRLNTVTVIFGLLFWGYIWGVPGLLLSVPLMVFLRLLLENSSDLNMMARVMGFPESRSRSGKKKKTPVEKPRT